ncbi:secretion protein F [Paenibacillus timonensis]|uniref:Secretion protein F n=1 Tax=Paenibacillus timonensis TaxID=225915 RepID=A0ABW3S9I1_9BACL|nr:secretion protein F [Paenibacillus timonensis]MCH1638892.1 secretion protein F [Paenibacillus timonensis]
MMGWLVSFDFFVTVGAYLIFAAWLKLPTLASTRAILKVAKIGQQKDSPIQALIFRLSAWLAGKVTLGDYYKRKTAATLRSAGIQTTPEMYIAGAIVKAALIFGGGLFLLPLLPLLFPVFVFLAIAIFFKESRSADEIVRKKREQIEMELPRFVATVAQELKATRDVLRILEVYARHAGGSLQSELWMTVADMKSGNQETALLRLESRIGSTMLSDVIRGLLAVMRGDQGVVYFEMLAHDFKLMEIQRLKLIAMKRPGKIRKYSFYMLVCFMLMYMVILGMEIMKAMGKLF